VLLIVASPDDRDASALAAAWAEHDAHVLTSGDLSAGRWRYTPGAADRSTLGYASHSLVASGLSGVLTRLTCVTPSDLAHVRPQDRAYVAAEMNAFLVAWLSDLSCRVVNRPTPSCLAGPAWPPEVWVRLAARVGVPVRPVRRQVRLRAVQPPAPLTEGCTVVVVIGDRVFGNVDASLHRHARDVARAAGTVLLEVGFEGPDPGARLVVANPRPSLRAPDLIEAVGAYLADEAAC
jgi:hypothetical protein